MITELIGMIGGAAGSAPPSLESEAGANVGGNTVVYNGKPEAIDGGNYLPWIVAGVLLVYVLRK
jgi:hypothetical protein